MSDAPIDDPPVERKGGKCINCGWKGHASEVDSWFLPLGQEGFGEECQRWACPECGTECEPVVLDEPVDVQKKSGEDSRG